MATGITKLRFHVQDDIIVLRETVGQNPFEDSSKWKTVTDSVVRGTGKSYSIRAVREHVIHLIKLWKNDDFGNLRKMGTIEQYQEKEQLLQEVMALQEMFVRPRKRIKREEGASLRDEVLENVQVILEDAPVSMDDSLLLESDNNCDVAEDSTSGVVSIDNMKYENCDRLSHVTYENCDPLSVPGPSTIVQPQLKGNFLEYLRTGEIENRNKEMELNVRKEELEIEKRKLDLQERQTALEEKKFALEEEKIREKMRLEALEQEERLKQAEQQRKLLDMFVAKFVKER